jgi:phosphoheptose isomerase
LKQKNNLTIGGISGYLEEYVIATSISTLENIKTQDYLFYKDIKALQEVGEIVVCPETENDVYPVSSTTTAAVAQNAQVVALPTLNTG